MAGLVPEAGVLLGRGTNQGIVPDFVLRAMHAGGPGLGPERLYELKNIYMSTVPGGRYSATRSTKAGSAVDARQRLLHAEYIRKARKVDDDYGEEGHAKPGPAERKLGSFPGGVQGIVFGVFGECSKHTEQLIDDLAAAGSHKHFRNMLVSTPQVAKGMLKGMIRQNWAFAAMRESARVMIHRLRDYTYGGRGGAAAPPPPRQQPSEAAREYAQAIRLAFSATARGNYY